ncbi:MAG TPA: hypothetical protein VEA69_15115 [Tepidisphaeraceae bacterium]|nr:hypothetical protein [Tepidisphaeraceae bacterium]
MSDLRKQLDAARETYQASRYPGDLAGELLGVSGGALAPRAEVGRGSRWRVGLATAAGVAAAVAAVMTVVSVLNRPTGPGVLPAVEAEVAAAAFEVPGRPEMAGRPEMPPMETHVPAYVGLGDAGGVPEMPSRFDSL